MIGALCEAVFSVLVLNISNMMVHESRRIKNHGAGFNCGISLREAVASLSSLKG